jgi:hypothetical protein
MMSFNLFVRAEVSSVADGKRIKTKMLLRDQPTGLEFTDAGCVVEFLCPPGRPFSVWWDRRDDDNDNDPEVDPDPANDGPPVLVDAD